jgi:ribA/ribD-fused uncharacterized protein
MGTVEEFQGKFRFLSNFWPSRIKFAEFDFSCVECGYQAMKSDDPDVYKLFMYDTHISPGEAKRLGRTIVIRPGWEDIKDEVMFDLVVLKFDQNPDLREQLMDTWNYNLLEGNHWHDNYWGQCFCDRCKDIDGLNKLGNILMKVRDLYA